MFAADINKLDMQIRQKQELHARVCSYIYYIQCMYVGTLKLFRYTHAYVHSILDVYHAYSHVWLYNVSYTYISLGILWKHTYVNMCNTVEPLYFGHIGSILFLIITEMKLYSLGTRNDVLNFSLAWRVQI